MWHWFSNNNKIVFENELLHDEFIEMEASSLVKEGDNAVI